MNESQKTDENPGRYISRGVDVLDQEGQGGEEMIATAMGANPEATAEKIAHALNAWEKTCLALASAAAEIGKP